MYVDPEPKVEHEYDTDPSQDQTVVVSLDKSKYPRLDLAKSRAAEVFELRGLKPYKFFQTARHFCWKTVRR